MIVKTKQSLEEERELLLNNEEGFEKFQRNSYARFETAIAKGVANNVGKWPSHLFAAFLAASLVFATFVLFTLVMALFCIPPVNYTCRSSRNFECSEFPNVYFVKAANRSWTREELCYVEATARDNPEINIFLINLSAENRKNSSFPEVKTLNRRSQNKDLAKMLILWEVIKDSIDASSNETIESRTRKSLAARYANVRNVDVTIEDFFKGSMLSRDSRKLDIKTLEIAAKAYLLWNSSGIALSPLEYHRLGYLSEYLCTKECKTIKIASIDPEGKVLASGVPCQAFLGCLMHEIATNGIAKGRDVVKEAQASFCQRLRDCPGLKILNKDSPYISHSPFCPAIDQPEISPRSNKIDQRKFRNARDDRNIERVRQIFI